MKYCYYLHDINEKFRMRKKLIVLVFIDFKQSCDLNLKKICLILEGSGRKKIIKSSLNKLNISFNRFHSKVLTQLKSIL